MNVYFTESVCGYSGGFRRFVFPFFMNALFYRSKTQKSKAFIRATIEIYNSEDRVIFIKEYLASSKIQKKEKLSLLFPINNTIEYNVEIYEVWLRLVREIADDLIALQL